MQISCSKTSWTKFWRSSQLDVDLGAEEKWSKSEIYRTDSRRLLRLNVTQLAISQVQSTLDKFQSGYLQFHRLVYLFAKDPETVKQWTSTNNYSLAFIKLSNLLVRKSREEALSRLYELKLLMELFMKREIVQYEGKLGGSEDLSVISSQGMLGVLRSGDRNSSRFRIRKQFSFGKSRVYAMSRKSGANDEVYKFVVLQKRRKKILISLSVDSTEYRIRILRYVSKRLHIPIVKLTETPEISTFISFLKAGISGTFSITGIDFSIQGLKIGMSPMYSRPENIATSSYYQQLLPASDIDLLESIQRLRFSEASDLGNIQANLNFINYKNEDIIGGMRLSLNANGLDLTKRNVIKESFKRTFGFQLDIPLAFDVDEVEIYKKFLYNPPKKKKNIEIVSNKSIEISHNLSIYGLLPQPKSIEETAKICTYHGCSRKFREQWGAQGKVCTCGYPLWDKGTTVVTQVIDEIKVRDFIGKIAVKNGFLINSTQKDLLSRKIYPIEISKNGVSVCLIPITTQLKPLQLEILKYRYPCSVFVTSKSDKANLTTNGLIVEELYKLTYCLFDNPVSKLDELINQALNVRQQTLSQLSSTSSSRYLDIDWYKNHKNLGPEFYEADTTILLTYIFRNSIWLGARYRGQALPDSLSAFPIDKQIRGCFLTDAKFSLKEHSNIGSVPKNKKYVIDGIKNLSIRRSGGLKGFVFISNKASPSNFKSIMARVIGRKYIKAGYLTSVQVLSIYRHIKRWENEFEIDRNKANVFLDSMESIFTKPKSYKKVDKIIVWTDSEIDQILADNENKYRTMGNPALAV